MRLSDFTSRLLISAVALLVVPSVRAENGSGEKTPCQVEASGGLLDSDCDGLSDRAEDANANGRVDSGETNPFAEDTDGDGTHDAVEVSRGTDPNRDSYHSFPEPMVFDLVRGLDAQKGELEMNALIRNHPRRNGSLLQYAPEVEYAFANGAAVEVELPFENEHLSSVKGAIQKTLHFDEQRRFAHGIQALAEVGVFERTDAELALLHIGNARFGEKWSFVSISGIQGVYDRRTEDFHGALLVNWSGYYAIAQQVLIGLEGNLRLDDSGNTHWLVTPQAHVQLNNHFRLQLGMGAVRTATGGAEPLLSTRFIVEL